MVLSTQQSEYIKTIPANKFSWSALGKQLVNVLFWGGWYAVPYYILPKDEIANAGLTVPTMWDYVIDIIKLVLLVTIIYYAYKYIKKKFFK